MILGTIRGSVINDLIHGFRRTPKRDYQKQLSNALPRFAHSRGDYHRLNEI